MLRARPQVGCQDPLLTPAGILYRLASYTGRTLLSTSCLCQTSMARTDWWCWGSMKKPRSWSCWGGRHGARGHPAAPGNWPCGPTLEGPFPLHSYVLALPIPGSYSDPDGERCTFGDIRLARQACGPQILERDCPWICQSSSIKPTKPPSMDGSRRSHRGPPVFPATSCEKARTGSV